MLYGFFPLTLVFDCILFYLLLMYKLSLNIWSLLHETYNSKCRHNDYARYIISYSFLVYGNESRKGYKISEFCMALLNVGQMTFLMTIFQKKTLNELNIEAYELQFSNLTCNILRNLPFMVDQSFNLLRDVRTDENSYKKGFSICIRMSTLEIYILIK